MALLDVDEVLRDPLFTTKVRLSHYEQGFDSDGNPSWKRTSFTDCPAVVTSDEKQFSRLPESLRRDGTILVRVTVRDIPEGFSGSAFDRVVFRGRKFVVNSSGDYSQFGTGFIRMVCSPEETTDGSY